MSWAQPDLEIQEDFHVLIAHVRIVYGFTDGGELMAAQEKKRDGLNFQSEEPMGSRGTGCRGPVT